MDAPACCFQLPLPRFWRACYFISGGLTVAGALFPVSGEGFSDCPAPAVASAVKLALSLHRWRRGGLPVLPCRGPALPGGFIWAKGGLDVHC